MIKYKHFKCLFKHINSLCWENNAPDELIFEIAYKHFKNNKNNYTKNKNLIRLIGQSGAGKTTQLLPTAKKVAEQNNLSTFNACVRDFATLHPNYDALLKQYGQCEIREKTNCFALKCLAVNIVLAIESGYDIIFEVTLLSKYFEKFILNHLKKNKYNILNFCIAVNIEISNKFIDLRKNTKNSKENNRIVYSTSTNFFYKSLNSSLKFYTKKLPYSRIIIWNLFQTLPIYDNILKDCFNVFINNQKTTNKHILDENLLLDEKIKYVLKYVKLN